MSLDRKKERLEGRDNLNRFEEDRALETREANKNIVMHMSYRDKLYFPQELIPHGMEYRWIRETTLDKPDRGRQLDASKKGWVAVPASRHPEFLGKDLYGNSEHLNGFIQVTDCILCERSREIGIQEEALMDQKNSFVINSMPGLDNIMGDPHISIQSTVNKTNRTFGY